MRLGRQRTRGSIDTILEEGSALAGATEAALGDASPASQSVSSMTSSDESIDSLSAEVYDINKVVTRINQQDDGEIPKDITQRDPRNKYAELIHHMPIEKQEIEKEI